MPKTVSNRTILMVICSLRKQESIDFSPQKVLDTFEAISTIFDRYRGWNLSLDPMIQACILACRDLLCANGNIPLTLAIGVN